MKHSTIAALMGGAAAVVVYAVLEGAHNVDPLSYTVGCFTMAVYWMVSTLASAELQRKQGRRFYLHSGCVGPILIVGAVLVLTGWTPLQIVGGAMVMFALALPAMAISKPEDAQ